jgi:hypothetical protein
LGDDDARNEPVNDERAGQGVEHLQAAAQEMIEAARAFLDVVEDFVGDDEKVASVADAFASLARGATRAGRSGNAPPDDDEPFGGVQHIRVS